MANQNGWIFVRLAITCARFGDAAGLPKHRTTPSVGGAPSKDGLNLCQSLGDPVPWSCRTGTLWWTPREFSLGKVQNRSVLDQFWDGRNFGSSLCWLPDPTLPLTIIFKLSFTTRIPAFSCYPWWHLGPQHHTVPMNCFTLDRPWSFTAILRGFDLLLSMEKQLKKSLLPVLS